MHSTESTTYIADLVRRYDRDRFATTMFLPPGIRRRVQSIYAFNVDLARIKEIVTEPIIGQMRLQWWRDMLDSLERGDASPKGHPIAEALAPLIRDERLSIPLLFSIIDAREQDLDDRPFDTLEDLIGYCTDTSANLSLLALEVMSVADEKTKEAAKFVGIACALTGIARSARHHALSGWIALPAQLMEDENLSLQDLSSEKSVIGMASIVRIIASKARHYLDMARALSDEVDLRAGAVLLSATLADQYLYSLARYEYDLFHPKLAGQRGSIARLYWNAWRKKY